MQGVHTKFDVDRLIATIFIHYIIWLYILLDLCIENW